MLRFTAFQTTIRARQACRCPPRKEYPLKPVLIDASDLTPQQRTRGINAILIGQFFVMGGFFMVIPLMAVHYVEHLGWAAGTIGIILALRQFFQQSVTAFFGVLCDRIGPKPLLLGGMLLRVVSFVALGFSETFWPVLFSSLMVALSGSMFESPRAAALSALAPQEQRQRVFSKVGVAGGVGTAVGTQIGALLISQDFTYVCIAGAVAFVCVFVVLLLMMPHFGINLVTTGTGSALRAVLQDRVFVLYLIFLSGHWFAWTQFGLTVTLAATDISGNDGAVAWLYLAQTIVTVLFGYTLPRFLERWLSSLQLLIYGTAVMGVGLLLIGGSTNIAFVLIAAAVFSIGSVVARPGQETVTANLADPRAPGAYFGIASWSLAIGGGLGNYLGGVVYDVGQQSHPMAPWVFFALVALGSSAGLWAMRESFGKVRKVPKGPVNATVEATAGD
jgi:DHA1 family multidrug resistance protein-like MFS transporter